MKVLLNRTIKKTLNYFGVIAFKRSSGVYVPEEDAYRIISELTNSTSPVVIDGGAHRGDMVEKFRTLCPNAEFHCFEPDPSLARDLVDRFANTSKVYVNQTALGDALGKAEFNINMSSPTNSLLAYDEASQPDLKQLCELKERIVVDVTSIDEYCRRHAIATVDVIKLDLQGYDYVALEGAKITLERAQLVLVEVMFEEIYQDCHCFPDILQLMDSAGYRLFTLCGLHYGKESNLKWADAVFVKKRNH